MPAPIDETATVPYYSFMKNAFIFLLYLFGHLAVNVQAEPSYIWPMKLTPELTSKFCDYRSGHFHAGLDIRTQGRTGFRVYAIDDGYIYRAAASFRGYGRAIYLKLHDGRIAVYGHLSGFPKPVEGRIFTEQMKSDRYFQDIYFTPGEYPVKKGDVVGLSGESGPGAPHLHFELRSPDNNPINPLLAGLDVKDRGKPEFHDLAIKYFGQHYLPEGSFENYDQVEVIPVNSSMSREHSVVDTIILDRPITLAVSGGDRINGAGYLYGFYGLKLLVDDSLIFEMRSDSLSFSTTGQLNHIRDFDMIELFGARRKTDNDTHIFYRLYVPPFSRQYFWPGYAENGGVIEPSGKIGEVRRATIVAFDEAGNEAELRFCLREPELNSPAAEKIQCFRENDNLYFIFETPTRPRMKYLEYRNSPIEEFKPLTSTMTSTPGPPAAKESYIDTVKAVIPKGDRVYRIRYLDDNGRTSPWLYFREDATASNFWIEGSPDLLRIEYRFESGQYRPRVHIRNDSLEYSAIMRAVGPGLFQSEFRDRNLAGPLWVEIESGNSIVFDTTLVLYAVTPGYISEVISPDSTLRIQFDQSSAYNQAYIFPLGARRESTALGPAIIYDIRPASMLFDSPVKFIFDTHRLGITGSKAGVYGMSSNGGKWNFISRIESTKLEAKGIGLGRVAILEDGEPPVIKSVSPKGIISSAAPFLSCVIEDNLSGLPLDGGLSMKIDGQWIPAEYDIDTGRFAYKIKNSLKPGKHTLELKASDNQGNSVAKQSFFSVTGKKK